MPHHAVCLSCQKFKTHGSRRPVEFLAATHWSYFRDHDIRLVLRSPNGRLTKHRKIIAGDVVKDSDPLPWDFT